MILHFCASILGFYFVETPRDRVISVQNTKQIEYYHLLHLKINICELVISSPASTTPNMDPPDNYQTTCDSETKIVVFYSLSNAFILISGSKFRKNIVKIFLTVGESILLIHAQRTIQRTVIYGVVIVSRNLERTMKMTDLK